jgi:hypothetical protein
MANKKITELDALTTPAGDDLFAIVDDTDTTTKKVTVTNLMTQAPVQTSDLGTAAAKDVGTSNGNVVELDATGLPAVDGSQLTNLPSPSLSIVSEATTARTLSNSDKGKVIVCSSSSSVTITLPTGLTSGFSCTVVQNGTGTVKVEGGAAISAINNINATVGQYGHLNIIPIGSDAYLMEGEGQRLFGNVNSLEFDGVADQLDSGSNMPLGSSGEFTVVAWFKTTDVDSGKEAILSFGTSSYFALRTTGASTEIRETSGGQSLGSHSATDWNYVAVYHDGTNLKGSLNGASFVAKTRQHTYQETAFQDAIKIGNLTIASQFFPGKIDEVAWWDSAVSESDLINIYNSGVPINLTSYSPNHWWRMGDSDGGFGSIVSDEIGSNDLTITGATFSTDVPS